jgi:hypothetical protein
LNPSNWLSHLHPDDVENISRLWYTVLRGPLSISCEFRWIHPPDEGYSSSEEIVSWCSMAVAPEMDDEGNLIRVFGAIVDISDRKRAEQEQKRRLEESVELRRQQENFIDMTSHEVLPFVVVLTVDAEPIVCDIAIFRYGVAMSDKSETETYSCDITS